MNMLKAQALQRAADTLLHDESELPLAIHGEIETIKEAYTCARDAAHDAHVLARSLGTRDRTTVRAHARRLRSSREVMESCLSSLKTTGWREEERRYDAATLREASGIVDDESLCDDLRLLADAAAASNTSIHKARAIAIRYHTGRRTRQADDRSMTRLQALVDDASAPSRLMALAITNSFAKRFNKLAEALDNTYDDRYVDQLAGIDEKKAATALSNLAMKARESAFPLLVMDLRHVPQHCLGYIEVRCAPIRGVILAPRDACRDDHIACVFILDDDTVIAASKYVLERLRRAANMNDEELRSVMLDAITCALPTCQIADVTPELALANLTLNRRILDTPLSDLPTLSEVALSEKSACGTVVYDTAKSSLSDGKSTIRAIIARTDSEIPNTPPMTRAIVQTNLPRQTERIVCIDNDTFNKLVDYTNSDSADIGRKIRRLLDTLPDFELSPMLQALI